MRNNKRLLIISLSSSVNSLKQKSLSTRPLVISLINQNLVTQTTVIGTIPHT